MKLQIYIDEAWRWPLAGPVYTGLVLVIKNFEKTIFQDSKTLSEKRREFLYTKINKLQNEGKIIYSSWECSNKEIDKKWISKALNLSIKKWIKDILIKYLYFTKGKKLWNSNIKQLGKKLLQEGEKIESLIIDGNNDFFLSKDLNIKTFKIKKWDQKIPFISMASIIAKVERDNIMKLMSYKYPYYGFEKHKWYWTQRHIENIKKYWICKIHRKSFLKKYI